MSVEIDPALRPEGWRPKGGSRVRILPETKAAPDDPESPPGVWEVWSDGPEQGTRWVQPIDGDAKAWSVVQLAGRREKPHGWPCISVPSRRLFPAALVQRGLPGC